MLNFLRKYQKIVFGVVTAALIVSISFFGSYNAFLQKPVKEKDFILGTAVDGSPISHLEIEKLSRFIASDAMDLDAYEHNRYPNYFNDGIIRKEFLESGIAEMLIQQYFDDLKVDLGERLEKQKRFKPYAHPEAPFLSAETVWSQFLPSLGHNLAKLKNEEFKLSKENVSTLVSLYLDSSKFPSYMLRRFLAYQENQYQWIKKDYYLQSGDLSLFYFHSFEDWFGKTFLNLISQVIHNGAIYAKGKGYKVSYEEAKADLLRNGYESLKAQKQDGELSSEVLMKHWKEQLAYLGLTESEAVTIWEKVLLSRKLLDDYGNSIFLDRLSYENFHDYASEHVDADVYSLPTALRFNDFNKLMLFETYKDYTTKKTPSNLTSVDGEKLSIEKIKSSAPELLYKTYQIEYASVSKDKVQTYIGIQEMWDWQVSENNWKKLRVQFPEIAKADNELTENRLEILDSIPEGLRENIDSFSRKAMLDESMHVIEKALADSEMATETINISLAGEKQVLTGIKDAKALMKLLDSAALKEDEESSEDAVNQRKALENYSQDQENFYRIYVLERESNPKLYTFDLAISENILRPLLDKKLKSSYKAAKEAKPADFQNEDGSEKDFASVKDQIGKFVFRPLRKAIEKDYQSIYGKKYEVHPLEFYAKNRFLFAMHDKLKHVKDSSFDQKIFDDYSIEKLHKTIFRKQTEDYIDKSTFTMNEGEYSTIKSSNDGNLVFYQITEKSSKDLGKIASDVMSGQSQLVEDAKRHLMSDFLSKLEATDSIHLGKFKAIKAKES